MSEKLHGYLFLVDYKSLLRFLFTEYIPKARDIPFHVRFHDVRNCRRLDNLYDEFNLMFEDVLRQAGDGIVDGDISRVIIFHPELDNPIVITLQPWHQLTPESIRQSIQSVLNSNQNLTLNADFHIIVGMIHLPHGEARLQRLNDISYFRKYGIIQLRIRIKNV